MNSAQLQNPWGIINKNEVFIGYLESLMKWGVNRYYITYLLYLLI